MNRIALLALVVLLAMALPSTLKASSEPEITGFDDLVKAKSRFAETWVRPGADLSQYTKIYPTEALLHLSEDQGQPMRRTGSVVHRPVFDEEHLQKLKEVVSQAVIAELERTGFETVQESSPSTLILRIALLDITTQNGMERLDEATVLFDVIDSETGVIQARLGQRSNIPFGRNRPWEDVGLWAQKAAWDLQHTLRKAK
ncbi:MAG: DUF3313 domain-containing protein [bacterium]|nr:DUF3313 domain-containing protein [bacterium]